MIADLSWDRSGAAAERKNANSTQAWQGDACGWQISATTRSFSGDGTELNQRRLCGTAIAHRLYRNAWSRLPLGSAWPCSRPGSTNRRGPVSGGLMTRASMSDTVAIVRPALNTIRQADLIVRGNAGFALALACRGRAGLNAAG